jgi:hypothetical protein
MRRSRFETERLEDARRSEAAAEPGAPRRLREIVWVIHR